MIRNYKLPIQGAAIRREPLAGDKNNPIIVIPIKELPGIPTLLDPATQKQVPEGFSFTCLNYNIDEEWCEVELEASEEFHNWLANILPQLNDIKDARGWKLDKTKLEEK